MLAGPSTLLNLPNFAASVGSEGCVSDGGQKKEREEESSNALVLKLESDRTFRANKNITSPCIFTTEKPVV